MWLLNNMIFQVVLTIIAASVLVTIVRMTITRLVRRLVGGYEYAGRVVHRKQENQIDEQKRERTLIALFRTAASVLIWLITLIVVLWELRVNLAALLTGAGLIGVVVGLGAQNTIRDVLSGLFIIGENQYRVGDIVTFYIAGRDITGVVEDVTIRITRLRDTDGKLHIVRNGSPDVVANQTFGYANVNIDVDVALDTDIDKVQRVLNEVGVALSEDAEWKDSIVDPITFLRLDSFEGGTLSIKALGKVEPSMQWAVAGEFRRRLVKAFAKNHIAII